MSTAATSPTISVDHTIPVKSGRRARVIMRSGATSTIRIAKRAPYQLYRKRQSIAVQPNRQHHRRQTQEIKRPCVMANFLHQWGGFGMGAHIALGNGRQKRAGVISTS